MLVVVVGLVVGIGLVLVVLQHVLKKPTDITGKHVMVTGGSSGIGLCVGVEAAKRGANVTLMARDPTRLEQAKEEVRRHLVSPQTQKVHTVSADVSGDYEEVERAVEAAQDEMGPVAVMVACAGTSVSARFEDTPLQEFQRLMKINYMGTVHAIRATLPTMKRSGGGHIVLVSSVAGSMGVFGYTAYSGSKFALRGLAESLQMEVRPYGVKVTLSMPPDTDTPGFREEEKSKPQETRLISSAGGVMSPQVVANDLVRDALLGKFLSTSGFDAWMVTLVTSGMSPVASALELSAQVFLMGVVRFVGVLHLLHFDRIVRKCVKTRDQNKKLE